MMRFVSGDAVVEMCSPTATGVTFTTVTSVACSPNGKHVAINNAPNSFLFIILLLITISISLYIHQVHEPCMNTFIIPL